MPQDDEMYYAVHLFEKKTKTTRAARDSPVHTTVRILPLIQTDFMTDLILILSFACKLTEYFSENGGSFPGHMIQ